eukprot:838246-Rhodomonas_salina.3
MVDAECGNGAFGGGNGAFRPSVHSGRKLQQRPHSSLAPRLVLHRLEASARSEGGRVRGTEERGRGHKASKLLWDACVWRLFARKPRSRPDMPEINWGGFTMGALTKTNCHRFSKVHIANHAGATALIALALALPCLAGNKLQITVDP